MSLTFTRQEIFDLLKSFVGISLIFWWVFGGLKIGTFGFIVVAIFVGLAFILHELAHKAMATFYGYRTEYRSNDLFMLASMFMAFFGFIFLAPGGVLVEQVRKLKHLGIISIVGPLTNILLALICVIASIWLPIARMGFEINAWLALFNMIPLWGMDGQKVLAWNRVAFAITIVVAGGLYLWTYFL